MVIRSLPNIKRRIPNVAYMIVGSGDEDTYLRDLAAALGVADCVVFVGSIRDDERAAYYSACDLFVMPNRKIDEDIEGFGMVFLEAGAAAKPVIGGISGGTGEAIQNGITGLRVDGENVEAISEAIVDLASNTERALAMGVNGRHWVDSEFRWDSVVERTRQLTAHILREDC
jgi:phosphatidylinositol alpha-1,6-mannosyltransferase